MDFENIFNLIKAKREIIRKLQNQIKELEEIIENIE